MDQLAFQKDHTAPSIHLVLLISSYTHMGGVLFPTFNSWVHSNFYLPKTSVGVGLLLIEVWVFIVIASAILTTHTNYFISLPNILEKQSILGLKDNQYQLFIEKTKHDCIF